MGQFEFPTRANRIKKQSENGKIKTFGFRIKNMTFETNFVHRKHNNNAIGKFQNDAGIRRQIFEMHFRIALLTSMIRQIHYRVTLFTPIVWQVRFVIALFAW